MSCDCNGWTLARLDRQPQPELADFGQDMFQADAPATPRKLDAGDLMLLAGVAWLAYTFGRSRGARAKGPMPTLAGTFAGYVGLRTMDKVLGGLFR